MAYFIPNLFILNCIKLQRKSKPSQFKKIENEINPTQISTRKRDRLMGRTLRRSKSFRDKGLRHWNWGSSTCKMLSHYQLYQLALLCNKPFQSLVASNNNHLLFLMILWAALVILLIWVYSADHCWALSCVWSASDLAGAGSPWIASGTWLTLGSLLAGTLHSSSTWSLFLQ